MPAFLVPKLGGDPIPLNKPIVLLGRNSDCDAVLTASGKVSRRHCCIARINDRFVVRDLGSMNGVRVNGKRRVETVLASGDQVMIGDIAFTFRQEQTVLPQNRAGAAGNDRAPVSPRPQPAGYDGQVTSLPTAPAKPAPLLSPDLQPSFEFPVAIPEDSLPAAAPELPPPVDDPASDTPPAGSRLRLPPEDDLRLKEGSDEELVSSRK